MATWGFGLAGETQLDTVLAAARNAEHADYDTFWLSQPNQGSTLASLQAISQHTSAIRIGVGAIPFTRQGPDRMYEEILDLSLPVTRLRLGVGSGTGSGSLERLRHGVERLRSLIDVEIVVAALGPKMCALAGELADTVLLNWLTPEHAATSISWIAEGAAKVGRNTPLAAAYIRCALGVDARQQLDAECERYGSFPHYAAHFARQGVRPIDTTIWEQDPATLQERLREYQRILDHVVVRAITPQDSPRDVQTLVDVAKPPPDSLG